MTSDIRKAENEALFRSLNERLEQAVLRKRRRSDAFLIVCECRDVQCLERIDISVAAYERIRRDPRSFIVKAGHQDPAIERTTIECENYLVVEKVGEAAVEAVETDPR